MIYNKQGPKGILLPRVLLLVLAFLVTNCTLFNRGEPEVWITNKEYPDYYLSKFKLLEHQKIWKEGPHNAFTDIIFFKEYYYIVFREATQHMTPDGTIRLLRSKDAKSWEDITKLSFPKADLRDPKLNVTPTNKLSISASARFPNNKDKESEYRTYIWISNNGLEWSKPHPISKMGYWLWRFTWNHQMNKAYGFSYKTGDNYLNLHESDTSTNFKVERYKIFKEGKPTESDIVFLDNNLAISLVRRAPSQNSVIGYSKKPYQDWHWDNLKYKISSPKLIKLPDNRLVAGVRFLEPYRYTSICLLDPVNKKINQVLKLPSNGDNGYPGLVYNDNKLVVSYYSTPKGRKTSIFTAIIDIEINK